jgi:hypothetical protein
MEKASAKNPNVCLGCAQLLEDLSPLQAVHDMDCDPGPPHSIATLGFSADPTLLTPAQSGDAGIGP